MCWSVGADGTSGQGHSILPEDCMFLGVHGWAVARTIIVRLEVTRFTYDMVLLDPHIFLCLCFSLSQLP